jgi:small-conductance mechanosensitive channel
MSIDMLARTIQTSLAPVVMVSACAILLTGLLSHYAAINDRMRAMVNEHFTLHQTSQDRFVTERLETIDKQLPILLRHHRFLHNAVLTVYLAVFVFLIDMVLITLAVITAISWLTVAVLITFLVGAGVLLVGIGIAAIEVTTSHYAIHYEVRHFLQSTGRQG